MSINSMIIKDTEKFTCLPKICCAKLHTVQPTTLSAPDEWTGIVQMRVELVLIVVYLLSEGAL